MDQRVKNINPIMQGHKGSIRVQQRGLSQKERESLNAKRYRLKHRIKVNAGRKKSQRKWVLWNVFGLTVEQYNDLLKSQNGLCAICFLPPKGKDLAVDHCHRTNKNRGLLCDLCNRALGQFKDSPENLRRAAEYVEKA